MNCANAIKEWVIYDAKLQVFIEYSNEEFKDFVNNRLKNVKPWDTVAFAFVKTVKSTKWKGYADAKSIIPFITGKDEEYLKSLAENDFTADDIPDVFE